LSEALNLCSGLLIIGFYFESWSTGVILPIGAPDPRPMLWQFDETYNRVEGKWRYLWLIADYEGRFVDFRLTARRK
jgi:hypothetical protein